MDSFMGSINVQYKWHKSLCETKNILFLLQLKRTRTYNCLHWPLAMLFRETRKTEVASSKTLRMGRLNVLFLSQIRNKEFLPRESALQKTNK